MVYGIFTKSARRREAPYEIVAEGLQLSGAGAGMTMGCGDDRRQDTLKLRLNFTDFHLAA